MKQPSPSAAVVASIAAREVSYQGVRVVWQRCPILYARQCPYAQHSQTRPLAENRLDDACGRGRSRGGAVPNAQSEPRRGQQRQQSHQRQTLRREEVVRSLFAFFFFFFPVHTVLESGIICQFSRRFWKRLRERMPQTAIEEHDCAVMLQDTLRKDNYMGRKNTKHNEEGGTSSVSVTIKTETIVRAPTFWLAIGTHLSSHQRPCLLRIGNRGWSARSCLGWS